MTPHRLDDIVEARAIAVVGASQDPRRIGGRPIRFLRDAGFAGRVYPVNAKYREVQGLACYPDLASIPGAVDVAIVSVPAREAIGVIGECGRKGVKGAIVFSSGFGEVGDAGRALEWELAEAARQAGVRILGPNCQGFVALHQGLNASFSSTFADPCPPGDVAVVAQSGAVGGMLATELRALGIGLSHWISSGNEADVDAAECIEFFARDDRTRIIGGYVENVRSGRRLLAAVAAARTAGKGVVLLRSARSPAAARAAGSHTGAETTDDRVTRALLAQAGAVAVRDVQELVDVLYCRARVAGPVGRRIGIVSNSGGLGVIMTDVAADLGLEVPRLSDTLQRDLASFLPAFGAFGNPVDITAQVLADRTLLSRALEALLGAAEIDVVAVVLAMVNRLYPVDAIVRDLVGLAAGAPKPIVVTWMSGAPEGPQALHAAGLPVFDDATRCLRAIGALAQFRATGPAPDDRVSSVAPDALAALAGAEAGVLDGARAVRLLAIYGLHVEGRPPGAAGGDTLPLVLRAWRDSLFGPVIELRAGGLLGEALDDGAVLAAPAGVDAVLDALAALRIRPLLGGARAERERLAETAAALSRLVFDVRDVVARVELEVILERAAPRRVRVVGARVTVERDA